MSGFTTLSSRSLAGPLMLHSGSCCPTMDVAVLSSPPISASDAEVHLYRLGGSSTNFGGEEADEQDDFDDGDGDGDGDADYPQPFSSSSSSRVWQVIVPSKKADVQAPPAQQQQDRKGKGRASKAAAAPLEEAYIQPRPPESVAWSPDGQLVAFASSTADACVLSVYDGESSVSDIPIARNDASTSAPHATQQLYFLDWEDCLAPAQRPQLADITTEKLQKTLPRLPSLAKKTDTSKPGNFTHQFNMGLNKPYTPAVPLRIANLPSLVPPRRNLVDTDSDSEDVDGIDFRDEALEAELKAWKPTLLLAGDGSGRLHLLLDGTVSLGSVMLGQDADIIAASIAEVHATAPSPLRPAMHSLTLSILMSISTTTPVHQIPAAISSCLEVPPVNAPPDSQTVIHCFADIPHFPSQDSNNLARACSTIRTLLAHATEAFDIARQAREESNQMRKRWLDRLNDDQPGMSAMLQLLMLLLTGKPVNNNLHEFFASANTQRAFERWETAANEALAKLRNTAYQSITPVCERVMLWLDQVRGWSRWEDRYGHLGVSENLLDDCQAVVQLLLLRAMDMENEAIEEELAFRDFCTWIKFELERIANMEANSEARVNPKHDVVAVSAYLMDRLDTQTLDAIVKVEAESERARYGLVLAAWLQAYTSANNDDNLRNEGKQKLDKMLEHIKRQVQPYLNLSSDDVVSGDNDQDSGDEDGLPDDLPDLDLQRLMLDPPQVINDIDTLDGGPAEILSATTLPIAVVLQELSKRVAMLFEQAFATVSAGIVLRDATPIVTWQPPEREEDESMTVLGLARDPTRITTHLTRMENATGQSTATRWVAFETMPGIVNGLPADTTVWLIRIAGESPVYGACFAAQYDGQAVDVLDIDFFDDKEVAFLVRLRKPGSRQVRYGLGTLLYQSMDMHEQPSGTLSFPESESAQALPFHRFHPFDSTFEPLQISLNGRKGRRVGCILGNLGRVLLVLDMDEDDVDDDDGTTQGTVLADMEDAENDPSAAFYHDDIFAGPGQDEEDMEL